MNFFTALGLLLIVLKLIGFITLSWWLVLLPIYGPLVMAAVVFGLIFIAKAAWS